MSLQRTQIKGFSQDKIFTKLIIVQCIFCRFQPQFTQLRFLAGHLCLMAPKLRVIKAKFKRKFTKPFDFVPDFLPHWHFNKLCISPLLCHTSE